MPANMKDSAVVTGLEKVIFHSIPNSNAKKCSNYQMITLISHTIKVLLKILQAWLQQYMNQELTDIKAEMDVFLELSCFFHALGKYKALG